MSEELKAFEKIKKMYEHFVTNYRGLEPKLMICEKEDFATIETALKDYERLLKMRKTAEWADEKLQTKKKLKSLEIIKEKKVDVGALCELDLELYNKYAKEINGTPTLTQEEFDLLREVLL